jgi:D-sedoheptulose 7-phosphate isomerase
MRSAITSAIEAHQRVAAALLETCVDGLEEAARRLVGCYRAGGKVLMLGNGGSAADAQHFAAELVGRFRRERRALPAMALTTDSSILTAVANDYGFDEVFARQIRAHAVPGDVVVGLSTSGASENVCRAFRAARENGAFTLALTGGTGGPLRYLADLVLVAPSDDTARIQEAHIIMIHVLCDAVVAGA